VCSSILSKRIKQFHDNAADLLPFLKEHTNFTEVSTDQELEKSVDTIYRFTEPCIINIRDGSKVELQQEIMTNLCGNHGFINLDVTALQAAETERGTDIGKEFVKLAKQDKNVPAGLIVRMLNRIIYCGQPNLNKFILSNFPNQIDQVKEFEAGCAKLAAIIYPTGSSTVVDIPQKSLSLFNIESLFQKEFRLKTMSEWSFQLFNEKLGNKVEYGILVGKEFAGKSLAGTILAETQGYTVIDMAKIADAVKATLGTEEEPFEGDVPLADVEKSV